LKLPSKCPSCGGNRIHTETGRDICRYYEDGILVKESNAPLPRRVFCDGCNYEFYQEEELE